MKPEHISLAKKLIAYCKGSIDDQSWLDLFAKTEEISGSLKECAAFRGKNQETLLHQLCERASPGVILAYLNYLDAPTLNQLFSMRDEFDHPPLYILARRFRLTQDFMQILEKLPSATWSQFLTEAVDTTKTATVFHGYYTHQITKWRPRFVLECLSLPVDPQKSELPPTLILEQITSLDLNKVADQSEFLDRLTESWIVPVFEKLELAVLENALLKVSARKSSSGMYPKQIGQVDRGATIVRLLEIETMSPIKLDAILSKSPSLDTLYRNLFTTGRVRLSHRLHASFLNLGADVFITFPLLLITGPSIAIENALGTTGVTFKAAPDRVQNPLLLKIIEMAMAWLAGNTEYNIDDIFDAIKRSKEPHSEPVQQHLTTFFNVLCTHCIDNVGDIQKKRKLLESGAKNELSGAKESLAVYTKHLAEMKSSSATSSQATKSSFFASANAQATKKADANNSAQYGVENTHASTATSATSHTASTADDKIVYPPRLADDRDLRAASSTSSTSQISIGTISFPQPPRGNPPIISGPAYSNPMAAESVTVDAIQAHAQRVEDLLTTAPSVPRREDREEAQTVVENTESRVPAR